MHFTHFACSRFYETLAFKWCTHRLYLRNKAKRKLSKFLKYRYMQMTVLCRIDMPLGFVPNDVNIHFLRMVLYKNTVNTSETIP